MRLIYMGTPDFAVPAMEALNEAGHEILYAVTQPDAVRDRGKKVKFSPVKEKAVQLGIPVLQPEKLKKDREFEAVLREAKPDAIIVAAYGQILPKAVLDIPEHGCLNIHASILPRFRGAAPIQASIAEGDEKTGVTIMLMDEGLDTGDMLAVAETLTDRKTGQELHDELADMGAGLIVETLKDLQRRMAQRKKQDDSMSTYAPMISKADGHIDFSQTPEKIERMIRAFDPWPGTFAGLGDAVLKLWRAEPLHEKTDAAPGTVLRTGDDGIDIAAGGEILRVTQLQASGRKRMAAKDYLRGNSIEIGSILR